MDNVKEFINENKKLVKWVAFGIVVFAVISIVIYNIRQVAIQEVQKEKEEAGIIVYLTSLQEQLVINYDTKTEEVIRLLENSKWMDAYQKKALFMSNREIVERDEKNEIRSTYAICAIDKSSEKIDGRYQTTYNITILNGENKYQNISFVKVSSSDAEEAPIYTATISSDEVFRNAKTYIRCSNTDSFEIKSWQTNANQFIDNKYDDMYKVLKDYCATNLPAVSAVVWSETVTLNYFANNVQLNFLTDNSHKTNLIIVYDRQNGDFNIERK